MKSDRWPTLGDLALIILVALLFIIAMGSLGCKSSRPVVPCPECEQTIVTEVVPAPCVIEIAPLAAPDLPGMPPDPGHDADEREMKAWALLVGEAVEQREAIWQRREEAWQRKIAAHNAESPKCNHGVVP